MPLLPSALLPSALLFEQLFDPASSTYTYLIGDPAAGVAALVDPVREQLERDLDRVAAHDVRLIHTIETHIHADHVTAGNLLAERCGTVPVVHRDSAVECQALRIADGAELALGGLTLRAIATPGHTPESLSFLVGDRLLTGDGLMIGGCGRTDFQGGDPGQLFDAVHARLFTLPDDTVVYPGHDYKGRTSSTIGVEKRKNSRLVGRTREQFIELMNNLDLAPPAKIQEALPANLRCGKPT